MVLEIAAVLFLVCGLGMLSRLTARLRDVACYVSKLAYGRASWAHAPGSQYLAASLDFQLRFADDKPSRFFHSGDQPPSSQSVRTNRQHAGESVYSGGARSTICKPLDGWPAGRIFRPCKRPHLGLQITSNE